jgi:hypothetical protein
MISKQVVDIPLGGGLSNKVYDKLVQPGAMLSLTNAKHDKAGTIAKRHGYDAYQESFSVYYDIPQIIANARVSDVDDMQRPVSARVVSKDCPTAIGAYQVTASDMAVDSRGYRAVCYCDTTNSSGYMSVHDADGNVAWSTDVVGMTTTPRVIAVSEGYFYFIYLANSGTQLAVYVLDTSGVVSYSNSNIDNGVTTNCGVEVVGTPTSWALPSGHTTKGVVIAYCKGTDVVLQQVTIDGTTNCFKYTYTAGAFAATPTTPFGLIASDREICCAWGIAAGGHEIIVNDSGYRQASNFGAGLSLSAPTGFYEINGAYDYFVWYVPSRVTLAGTTYYWATLSLYVRSYRFSGAYLKIEGGTTWASQAIVSKFFEFGVNEYFCWTYFGHTAAAATTESTQQKYLLRRVRFNSSTLGLIQSSDRTVATALEGEAMPVVVWRAITAVAQPCSMVNLGGGEYAAPLIRSRIANQTGDTSGMRNNTQVSEVEFSMLAPIRDDVINGRIHFTGGSLWSVDGDILYENNFLRYPECVATSSSTTGGGLSNGTYYLKFTFRHVPPGGGVVESAPSLPTTVVLSGGGSTQKITATVSGYAVGARPYKVIPYISTDNVVYYEAPNTSWGESIAKVNHANVDITHVVSTNRILYTVGGGVDNGSSGSVCDVCEQDNRIYAITPSARLLYSKSLVAGEEVAFSPDYLFKQLYDDGGGYYQVESFNGSMIVLGVNSLQIVTGQGDDLGYNSGMSYARVVLSDFGIMNGSPALATRDGIWFQAKDGSIRRILSDGTVDAQVGFPVDDYRSSVVVGIDVVGDEVRFTTTSEMIVYNQAFGTWCVRSVAGVGSCVWRDSHTVVKDDGSIVVEGVGFSDNGTAQGLSVETPWVRIGSLQGVQRVGRISLTTEYIADHDLKVSVYIDNETTVSTSWTQTCESLTVGQVCYFRWHFGKRCSSIKVKIEDIGVGVSTPSATESLRIIGLQIELGLKKGVKRLSQSNGIGSE